jgi:CRISPR-associated exonuclease Cas4
VTQPIEPPPPETLPLPPEVDPWAIEVSDLKQYGYCPRVVYYRYRFPDFRPETYKMESGETAHDRTRRQMRRRLPRGLPEGRVFHERLLYAPSLRLVGKIDLLIETEDSVIVVDYKNARRVRPNWKDQLAAYALLAETALGKPAREGYVYLIPLRKLEAVPLSTRRKKAIETRIADIIHMIQEEKQPDPTPQRNRCLDCEYKRFCNDLF